MNKSGLRSGLLSLSLEQGKKRHTNYLTNLEAASGDITLGLTTLTEPRDQHLVVLVNEVEATIARDEASDLLAVLNKLNAHPLTNSGVRLLGLQTTVEKNRKGTTKSRSMRREA